MTPFPTNPFPAPPPPSRPSPIACPFKVGDRIRELRFDTILRNWVINEAVPPATVTAMTAAGFDYVYDYPLAIGPARWGQIAEGGTCYPEGYKFYRIIQ